MKKLRLKEAAAYLGYSPRTLQGWDNSGKLKSRRTETNRRYYLESDLDGFLCIKREEKVRRIVAYCRVSSNAQKPDLKNQRAAMETYCTAKGYANVEYVEEIGGGLNFNRPKFLELVHSIVRGEVSVLVVAHKDRLCRFGFELIQKLCEKAGTSVEVMNSEKLSPEQEMVQDLMTIVHCFSSRLYGLRSYGKTLKQALK